MPELKYKINNTHTEDYITVPCNMDKEISVNKYIYGYDGYKKKIKLLKFYLNPVTFENYGNTTLMTDMIKKYDADKFIQNTLLMVNTTPELFTINNSHHIISVLLNLAFDNINNPNTRDAYISYNKILGYLDRNQLCKQLYGVDKSILTIQPLKIKSAMNNRTKEVVTKINNYLTNNTMYTKYGNATDDEKKQLNDIMELSETESESEFAIDWTKYIIKTPTRDKYTDISTYLPIEPEKPKLVPVRPAPSPPKSIKTNNTPTKPNYPPPPPPRTGSELQYHQNSEPIDPQSLFANELTDEQKERVQNSGLLEVVRQIRVKGKMLVPKVPCKNNCDFADRSYNHKIINSLPKPIANLFEKYPTELLLAGGYLTNIKIGVKCQSSDIDIFILDMNEDRYKEFNKDLIDTLRMMDIIYNARVIQMKSVLTVVSKYQNNIQFIRTDKKEGEAVVMTFDITNCSIGINNLGDASGFSTQSQLMINRDKTNKRTYTRTIKYLAKGFKIGDYNDKCKDDIIIDKVIEASKDENIIRECTKCCHPWTDSSEHVPTEAELEQKITTELKGKYIGNHFEEVNLKKFKFEECYYNTHNMHFAKNIEVMQNFDELDIVECRYGKYNKTNVNGGTIDFYKTTKPYYLNLIVNTCDLHVKTSPTSDNKTKKHLEVDLTAYPKIIEHIERFEKAVCDKLGIEYPHHHGELVSAIGGDERKMSKNICLEFREYNKLHKQITENGKYTNVRVDLTNDNINQDRDVMFRISLRHIFEQMYIYLKTKTKYYKLKFELMGPVRQSTMWTPGYKKLLEMKDYNDLQMTPISRGFPNSFNKYPVLRYAVQLKIHPNHYIVSLNPHSENNNTDKKYDLLIDLSEYPNEMKKIKELQDSLYNEEFKNNVIEKLVKNKGTKRPNSYYEQYIKAISSDIIKERIVSKEVNGKVIKKTYHNFKLTVNEEQYKQLCEYKKESRFVMIEANLKSMFIGPTICIKFNLRNIAQFASRPLISFENIDTINQVLTPPSETIVLEDIDSDTDYETEL